MTGMILKQIASRIQEKITTNNNPPLPAPDHGLRMLPKAINPGTPETSQELNRIFHAGIDSLARQFPVGISDAEKMSMVRSILLEFDAYRTNSETAFHEQLTCWRNVVTMLFNELLHWHGISPESPPAAEILDTAKSLTSAKEIQDWGRHLYEFLHPIDRNSPVDTSTAQLRATDPSSTNDNPVGLNGGGVALEQLRKIKQANRHAYVVFFHLNCLDVISKRFGQEVIEDCLMAIAANLTAHLPSTDLVYHWSDATLLAIVPRRVSEIMLSAELERIVAQSCENAIQIDNRSIMIRVPINFDIISTHRVHKPEDLLRLSVQSFNAGRL
jgi:GGDEF domain-containing protein